MKDVHELEIYAPIDGFPDYLISNHGRVLSLKYNKVRELKQQKNKITGYIHVTIRKNGKYYTFTIHRLVAQAFIPNPDNKPQVNHIDENKENNHVSNLEWTTAKENCNHGTHNEKLSKTMSNGRLKGKNNPMYGKHHSDETKQKISNSQIGKKLSEEHRQKIGKSQYKKVIGRNIIEHKVIVFKSVKQTEKYGFTPSNISACCRGIQKSHKGYTWQYLENNKKGGKIK